MMETREAVRATCPSTTRVSGNLEEHFAKLEARLTQLKAEVRQAQQLASMGSAVCSISHEFSNLLSPVLSYAQYALETDDTELHRKALQVTVKNVHVLVAMADRVLELSAAKETRQELVPLRQVVEDGAESLCRGFEKDGIKFRNDMGESLVAWADRLHLQQVFFNLFLNARDAMAPTRCGVLKVTGQRQGERVVIKVKDTGPGISEDIIGGVFDSFLTTKTSKRNGRDRCGGIGLALCRDLVTENGGTITVESPAGEGTTFTIELPAEQTS